MAALFFYMCSEKEGVESREEVGVERGQGKC